MDWLALAVIAQTVALAWIAAWQARAAQVTRKMNGDTAELLARHHKRLDEAEGKLEIVLPPVQPDL